MVNKGFFKHTEETKLKIKEMRAKQIMKPHTIQTKIKISNALKGIKRSGESKLKMSISKKGMISTFKGKHHTEESNLKNRLNHLGRKMSNVTKLKMSLSHKGKKNSNQHNLNIRKANLGNKSHFWKGGSSKLIWLIRDCLFYDIWRNSVFQRDNYTCQLCSLNNCYLEVHHKIKFSDILKKNNIHTFEEAINCEELWILDNGITLCSNCHSKQHNKKENNWRY